MFITTINKLIQDKAVDRASQISEEEIIKFENELGLKFGSQFKSYLKEFGVLTVEYFEFYGICGNNNAIPSAIHATKQNRNYDSDFPKNVVVFAERGDGVLWVIDEDDKVYLYDNKELIDTGKLFDNFVIDTVAGI